MLAKLLQSLGSMSGGGAQQQPQQNLLAAMLPLLMAAQGAGGPTNPTQTPTTLPSWVPQQYQNPILQAAGQHGVPPSILAALLKQESGFNPNATSPVGARGIAQFMPGTAKQYGINPLDPNQAIPAAAKFLASNYAKAGNWNDALAGYNAGPGRMNPNVWGRIPETRDYVSKVMGYAGSPQQTPAPLPQAPTIDPRLLALLALGGM